MPYELVYASHVAPHLDPRFIADIVRRARVKNRRLGVTGLLVFDGERFCQLFEGEQQTVQELARVIQRDPRHLGVDVLHEGMQRGPRRFGAWPLAFGLHDGHALGAVLARSTGLQMAEYLQAMTPRLLNFSAEDDAL